MSYYVSDCCGAAPVHIDFCSSCGKHCQVFYDGPSDYDGPFAESTDDGYDAARDACLTGDGPAFTSRQIEEDRAWAEECRRNER
jgi:hypothetical protein